MNLSIHEFTLELAHPFATARGVKTHQESIIVEVEHDGLSGYGEATPHPYFGHDRTRILRAIESLKPTLVDDDAQSPRATWQRMHEAMPEESFALCAVDVAIWDLHARQQGQSLRDHWSLPPHDGPATFYTIGLDEISIMVEKVKERHDWPIFKIKMGHDDDLDIVAALRRETGAEFVVDANAAWTLEKAIELIPKLKALGVTMIEQPLAIDARDEQRRLKKASPLPLVADESCLVEADLSHCEELFDGINIKLMKCGGLTPALRMIRKARFRGMKVMVGCMTESRIGASAIAQLSPLLDWLDADGPLLLKQDIARGVDYDHGRLLFPEGPGTGAELIA